VVTVRRYRPGDAAALARIYVDAVEAIGPRDHTAVQVAVWAGLVPTPARFDAKYTDGRTALVAVDGADRPLAFADVEADGHIDFLYCAPQAAGTGVAAALYDALEAAARQRGLPRLYSEASEAARRFFLKRGFRVIARRRLTIRGTAIHNYAVEKTLDREERTP
jgi:putative acetyltransferase